jgi:broad specificity phosphatase PhoE
MTSVTLVRHGTTEWIEQGRLHGSLDAPLSARGRHESDLAAQALAGRHFDALYTSPLGRARQTAAAIGRSVGLDPVPVDDLREMDFGWLEGGRLFNFTTDRPWQRRLRSAWISLVVRLSGEPRPRFGARVVAAFRQLAGRHPDQHILAVIHMAVRNNLLARLVDADPAAWVRYDGWPPCSFTELELDPQGPARVIRLEVSDHLSSLRGAP